MRDVTGSRPSHWWFHLLSFSSVFGIDTPLTDDGLATHPTPSIRGKKKGQETTSPLGEAEMALHGRKKAKKKI